MATSPRKTPGREGFTLVELAAVLFVLGLVLALAAPRLSGLGTPSRDAVLRSFALASEGAYDAALLTKVERRLVLDPAAGTWSFRNPSTPDSVASPEGWYPLALDGIWVDGEERRMDTPTEVRFLPGGVVPSLRIRLRTDPASGLRGEVWTLLLDPWSGTVDLEEGDVASAG